MSSLYDFLINNVHRKAFLTTHLLTLNKAGNYIINSSRLTIVPRVSCRLFQYLLVTFYHYGKLCLYVLNKSKRTQHCCCNAITTVLIDTEQWYANYLLAEVTRSINYILIRLLMIKMIRINVYYKYFIFKIFHLTNLAR